MKAISIAIIVILAVSASAQIPDWRISSCTDATCGNCTETPMNQFVWNNGCGVQSGIGYKLVCNATHGNLGLYQSNDCSGASLQTVSYKIGCTSMGSQSIKLTCTPPEPTPAPPAPLPKDPNAPPPAWSVEQCSDSTCSTCTKMDPNFKIEGQCASMSGSSSSLVCNAEGTRATIASYFNEGCSGTAANTITMNSGCTNGIKINCGPPPPATIAPLPGTSVSGGSSGSGPWNIESCTDSTCGTCTSTLTGSIAWNGDCASQSGTSAKITCSGGNATLKSWSSADCSGTPLVEQAYKEGCTAIGSSGLKLSCTPPVPATPAPAVTGTPTWVYENCDKYCDGCKSAIPAGVIKSWSGSCASGTDNSYQVTCSGGNATLVYFQGTGCSGTGSAAGTMKAGCTVIGSKSVNIGCASEGATGPTLPPSTLAPQGAIIVSLTIQGNKEMLRKWVESDPARAKKMIAAAIAKMMDVDINQVIVTDIKFGSLVTDFYTTDATLNKAAVEQKMATVQQYDQATYFNEIANDAQIPVSDMRVSNVAVETAAPTPAPGNSTSSASAAVTMAAIVAAIVMMAF